jgi:hypothetical protein
MGRREYIPKFPCPRTIKKPPEPALLPLDIKEPFVNLPQDGLFKPNRYAI